MADPVLTLSNLSKSFGALRATDDVSLTLEPGEIHALIGPNGAGKSTLIGQIAGRLAPDSGTIAFRGRDVTRLSTAQRARMGLGRTFQISSLIPEFSARRNVMLALQARQGEWADAGITSVAVIGDALAPGTIAACVWSGRRFAEELEETRDPDAPLFRREVTGLVAGPMPWET